MTDRTQPTNQQIAAWRAFLTVHARITEILERELEAERELPLGWYDVLVQLSEVEDGRLRMHNLAQLVLLSRAGLTRLVDRMARASLVERVPCEDDRRGTYVVMTASGARALGAAAPVHLRGVHEHFVRHLDAAELKTLEASMNRILRAESGSG